MLDGVELEFTKDALVTVAEKAIELKTGARGLRSIMEDVMNDIMYEIPSNDKIKKVTITKECVTDGALPRIVAEDKKAV